MHLDLEGLDMFLVFFLYLSNLYMKICTLTGNYSDVECRLLTGLLVGAPSLHFFFTNLTLERMYAIMGFILSRALRNS